MTRSEDDYLNNLQISRNKLKLLLLHHLNTITDSFINGNDPMLPIPLRSGYVVHSKNPDKFGKYSDFN